MNPKHMPLGDGLFDLGTESSKSLTEAMHPAPAPPHFEKVIGRTEPESRGEQDVIYPPHQIRLDLRSFSTLPRFKLLHCHALRSESTLNAKKNPPDDQIGRASCRERV